MSEPVISAEQDNINTAEAETAVVCGGGSALQQKLFNLRLKINKGRKDNRDEVEKEFKRMTDPDYDAKQRMSDAYELNGKKGGKKEDKLLNETAESAERVTQKLLEKEKHKSTFGWQAFTSEATFRAYEKRLPRIPKRDVKDSLDVATEEINPLDYGRVGAEVSLDGKERLKRDIEDRLASRDSFSRRRQTYDSSTVDSINEKNAFFNKKIKRSFDKYTVEIRQNLERGTAI